MPEWGSSVAMSCSSLLIIFTAYTLNLFNFDIEVKNCERLDSRRNSMT